MSAGIHSVGIHRGGNYWCAGCGDVKAPCKHFPPVLQAATTMLHALQQADLQIEYMQEKFKETGTGNAVRTLIQSAIKFAKGESL